MLCDLTLIMCWSVPHAYIDSDARWVKQTFSLSAQVFSFTGRTSQLVHNKLHSGLRGDRYQHLNYIRYVCETSLKQNRKKLRFAFRKLKQRKYFDQTTKNILENVMANWFSSNMWCASSAKQSERWSFIKRLDLKYFWWPLTGPGTDYSDEWKKLLRRLSRIGELLQELLSWWLKNRLKILIGISSTIPHIWCDAENVTRGKWHISW